MRSFLFCFFLSLIILPQCLHAQKMVGILTELSTGQPLSEVVYENIFSNESGTTDTSGRFSLTAKAGQLVVFQKLGYKTARLRVPAGNIPPFFKIQMEPGAMQLEEVEVRGRHRDYHNDSLRNASLYEHAITYPKMTTFDMIQHPFTALSKHYRQMMSFQKEYNFLEQQRYIDYAFNEKLITNLTGLTGDDLQAYMRQYRPSYEMLRAMPEYYFFSYIKESAVEWQRRKQHLPRRAPIRNNY